MPSTEPPPDGRRTRWDAHRVERRAQVVEAALEVLGEVGPEFGVDQVAARAGVTKPVIYRHFGDRGGLVAAMGERATAILFEERILPAVRTEDMPRERIRASVDAFLGFVADHPHAYRLFVHDDVAAAGKERIAAAVAAVLGDFLRAGLGDAGTAEVWAHGLVGFMQNVAEWWLERPAMHRDALAGYLTELVWAQIDGIARGHGVVLDPGVPLTPEEIARRAADEDPAHGDGGGRAAG